jgi:UDP-3-O-[3-hydroxymyristoyl] N-acetylglucosamine deacetylase
MVIKKPIKVSGEGKFIHLLPSPERGFSIDYTIDFAHPFLDRQSFSMSFSSGTTFSREVAGARTFGFLRDVELLRANGLAKGGSLENAVVVGDKDILNEDGLRYPDEFVRHKVLDLLGDISLVGVPIVGRIKAHRAGHAINLKLAQRVRKSSGKWKMVDSRVSSLNEEASKHYPALGQGLATA